MDEKVTLVFFGSEHYAPIVLSALFRDPLIKVVLVVSSQLSQKDIISPLKTLTDENHVPLDYWIAKDDLPALKENLISLSPRIFIVADFGQIIPQEIIDIPALGTIVVHPSLLPKYRGTTPVPATILNGDNIAGVSLILMDTKVDHGSLLAAAKTSLQGNETAPELLHNLFDTGAGMIPTVIRNLGSKSLTCNKLIGETSDQIEKYGYKFYYPPLEQDHSQASYTRRLERDSGRIDWSKSPEDIERMVRAYSGWPGTWTTIEELVNRNTPCSSSLSRTSFCHPDPPAGGEGSSVSVKENTASGLDSSEAPQNDHNKRTGKRVKILKAHIGDKGQLIIDQMQIEGKKPISWDEFARGYLK